MYFRFKLIHLHFLKKKIILPIVHYTLSLQDPRECVLWLTVAHQQKKALELFSREVAPAGTGMGRC